ncbi:hypothetical protein TL16_g12241 [Triparma laevis f. inornata]|uniref:Uncharacterized protein n=1 Tax=Triparma laevis f. inornata TaxID=1714386 RepID=A0A9W7BST6_9STRA|nr:hypothetical protein TL16_g12241 [Triparma laevis f. inornata]
MSSSKGQEGLNVGVSGNPTLKDELTGCAGALVGLVESIDGPRKNQKVTLRMGAPDDLLIVDSNFGCNVGDFIAVAPAGSVIGDLVVSKPKLLDEVHLGWTSGSSNCSVRLNAFDLLPGDSVPSTRPEKKKKVKEVDAMGNEIVEEGQESLFTTKVKLTKEEKLAAKKEKAKQKAIKNGTWVEPTEEPEELKIASKKEIKLARVNAKKRREKGEDDVDTDQELEENGLQQE